MTLQDPAAKVLLIDDDQQIHDLVRFHLEDRVGSVIVASDACSGRVLAAEEKPDLSLCRFLAASHCQISSSFSSSEKGS